MTVLLDIVIPLKRLAAHLLSSPMSGYSITIDEATIEKRFGATKCKRQHS